MNMVTAPLGTPNVCTYKVLCIYICKSVKLQSCSCPKQISPGQNWAKDNKSPYYARPPVASYFVYPLSLYL